MYVREYKTPLNKTQFIYLEDPIHGLGTDSYTASSNLLIPALVSPCFCVYFYAIFLMNRTIFSDEPTKMNGMNE